MLPLPISPGSTLPFPNPVVIVVVVVAAGKRDMTGVLRHILLVCFFLLRANLEVVRCEPFDS